jgi:hypothetical protein
MRERDPMAEYVLPELDYVPLPPHGGRPARPPHPYRLF